MNLNHNTVCTESTEAVIQSCFVNKCVFKGIVKQAKPCKCDIHLDSRILWYKWIIPFLKEWRFWYLILTSNFYHNFSLQVCVVPFQWRPPIFLGKNLWHRVLEAYKKQVSLKSYSLKIRIDSVNQILKNKEKIYINL